MGKNCELVTEIVGGEPYRYYPLGNYVVRAPDVCGGRPTFKHTRIEITGTLERLAAGEPIERIVEGYQSRVPVEAIIEAINIVNTRFGMVQITFTLCPSDYDESTHSFV